MEFGEGDLVRYRGNDDEIFNIRKAFPERGYYVISQWHPFSSSEGIVVDAHEIEEYINIHIEEVY